MIVKIDGLLVWITDFVLCWWVLLASSITTFWCQRLVCEQARSFRVTEFDVQYVLKGDAVTSFVICD